ncbi:MAG: di-heme oxidoredictase family protein [Myxococcaceae bacterium]
MRLLPISLLAVPLLWMACGAPAEPLEVVTDKALDAPLRGANTEEHDLFKRGDALFDLVYTDADGLGPLYIRSSCAACHQSALNGPAGVNKLVLVDSAGHPLADQSALPHGHTVRPFVGGGATRPISVPVNDPFIKVSLRLGPVVLGRGYMEAVADSEIERVAAEQARRGEVSGRVHRVTFTSEANPDQTFHRHVLGEPNLIGRFGYKARIATLDDFSADALQGDMGMTSPMRPSELSNPDALTDDYHAGADVDVDTVNELAGYLRLLEIPKRAGAATEGEALFAQVGCGQCHVATLHTRADYPIAALANIDAPIYTDLLLHDMGDGLADGLVDGDAGPREWRTPPLIGLSLLRMYLHDGRAKTLDAAIKGHQSTGSEANVVVDRFLALTEAERSSLLAFVRQL